MKAYIWQCGSLWHIKIKTPNNLWTNLVNTYPSRNQAVIACITYGLEVVP